MNIIERKIRTLCKDKVSDTFIEYILSENKDELTTMSIKQFKESVIMSGRYREYNNETNSKYSIWIDVDKEDDKINFDLLEYDVDDSIEGYKRLNRITYPPSVPN
jgi:hypothetical protein